MKTAEEMYPYLPNEENDIAIREYNQLMYGRREAYNEGVKAMQSYAHPSPMSAEQVNELAEKYASEEFDKHSFSEFKGAENSLWENRKADFIAGYKAATTPSVKADGWVSVDKEKEFQKVLKCLKNNKVMVGTREDGIYIRLAGRESEGEAFTLHFALAYPFPKLPPHQNKNK